MNETEVGMAFRRLWTKDIEEIIAHIEAGTRPISLSGIITDNREENLRRVAIAREVIAERSRSVLTGSTR